MDFVDMMVFKNERASFYEIELGGQHFLVKFKKLIFGLLGVVGQGQ